MVSMFARLHCATNSRTDSAVLPTFGGWAHTACPSREFRDALLVCADEVSPSATITDAVTTHAIVTMFRIVPVRRERAVRRLTRFLLIMIYAFFSSRTNSLVRLLF